MDIERIWRVAVNMDWCVGSGHIEECKDDNVKRKRCFVLETESDVERQMDGVDGYFTEDTVGVIYENSRSFHIRILLGFGSTGMRSLQIVVEVTSFWC